MATDSTPFPTSNEARFGLDRLTLAVAAGVLLLVLASIGAVLLTSARQAPPDLSTPAGVALAFELDLQRGEADQAYALLTSTNQASISQHDFALRAANFRATGNARYEARNVRVDGETAYLDLLATRSQGFGLFGLGASTYTGTSPVTLQREDDQWRISVPAEPFLLNPPAPAGPR